MTAIKHTPKRRVLVTGAGSGTGAATAELLAHEAAVVLVGRTASKLEETAARVRARGGSASVLPFDLSEDAVSSLVDVAGDVTDLVLAAGANSPRRAWADHDPEEFDRIVRTNFSSVAHLITAFLPSLRRHRGTVVAVSSLAAWTPSDVAGVAYRASKTALAALTDSLNREEAPNGVRATHLCPGDIDTDFLLQRPEVPSKLRRERMMSAEDVARVIAFVLASPPHLRIDELVMSPLGTISR